MSRVGGTIGIGIVLVFLMLTTSCAGHDRTIAATVEGIPVLAADVDRLTDAWFLRQDHIGEETPAALDRRGVRQIALTHLIRMAYLRKVALEKDVREPDAEAVKGLDRLLRSADFSAQGWSAADFARAVAAAGVSRRLALRVLPEVSVPELEVRRYYDEHAEAFDEQWSAAVEIAYFGSIQDARAAASLVEDGAGLRSAAVHELALETGRLSAVTDGSLLPETLRKAARQLPLGRLSEPVPAPGGWALIRVEGRQATPARTFAEARETIRALLVDQRRQDLFATWFKQRLSRAAVHVESAYGVWIAEEQRVA